MNPVESGIAAGSALSAIDDKSVVLNSYLSTIDRLKGWRPPLSLSFRRAPSKGGYLLKESKSRSNPTKKVWKKRYFVLGEGKLLYKDSSEAGARVKGECPLMGSVVSMIKEGEAGKRNCFKLMSGMMYLTLQCSSERQVCIVLFLRPLRDLNLCDSSILILFICSRHLLSYFWLCVALSHLISVVKTCVILSHLTLSCLVPHCLNSSSILLLCLVLSSLQMMDWASSVYHAISIANGGAYVLQYERDRVAAEEEVSFRFVRCFSYFLHL